jgi:hypothetical protein
VSLLVRSFISTACLFTVISCWLCSKAACSAFRFRSSNYILEPTSSYATRLPCSTFPTKTLLFSFYLANLSLHSSTSPSNTPNFAIFPLKSVNSASYSRNISFLSSICIYSYSFRCKVRPKFFTWFSSNYIFFLCTCLSMVFSASNYWRCYYSLSLTSFNFHYKLFTLSSNLSLISLFYLNNSFYSPITPLISLILGSTYYFFLTSCDYWVRMPAVSMRKLFCLDWSWTAASRLFIRERSLWISLELFTIYLPCTLAGLTWGSGTFYD